MEKSERRNIISLFIYFLAFYVSLNVLDGTIYQIFGIAFLISFLYGVVSVYKKEKFIF